MSYDRTLHEKIQQMAAGDLVHLMLKEYSPVCDPENDSGPCMQNTEYFWAAERLNELLPASRAAST